MGIWGVGVGEVGVGGVEVERVVVGRVGVGEVWVGGVGVGGMGVGELAGVRVGEVGVGRVGVPDCDTNSPTLCVFLAADLYSTSQVSRQIVFASTRLRVKSSSREVACVKFVRVKLSCIHNLSIIDITLRN